MTTTHTVAQGDTLASIAERFYGDGSQFTLITAANGITDPSLIFVGQVLIIPDRDQHDG